MEGKDGRTERATGKRRSEARDNGNLCLSTEVGTVAVLFLGFIGMRIAMPWMTSQMVTLWHEVMRIPYGPNEVWSGAQIQSWFISGSMFALALILPVVLPAMLGAYLANVGQVGFYFSMKPLEWKFGSLNPVSGFKQMFSVTALFTMATSILKVLLIGIVMYILVEDKVPIIVDLMLYEPLLTFQWIFQLLYRIAITVVVVFIVVAAIDYAYRWYTHEKGMMMTKKEVEDEQKNAELPAAVKSAQRKKMRELSLSRMMAAVPNASLVITNPTHVAVALEYDPANMGAPKVVAKGLRLVAQRIKAIAAENGIPIVEKPEVARQLYKHVKIGREVPSHLFGAVAEILAYLYRLGNERIRNTLSKVSKN